MYKALSGSPMKTLSHSGSHTKLYANNGSGRDSYIYANSGGFTTETKIPQPVGKNMSTQFKIGHYQPNKQLYGIGSGSSKMPPPWQTDGSGRDSYIYQNFGGFTLPDDHTKFLGRGDQYLQNLRSYQKSDRILFKNSPKFPRSSTQESKQDIFVNNQEQKTDKLVTDFQKIIQFKMRGLSPSIDKKVISKLMTQDASNEQQKSQIINHGSQHIPDYLLLGQFIIPNRKQQLEHLELAKKQAILSRKLSQPRLKSLSKEIESKLHLAQADTSTTDEKANQKKQQTTIQNQFKKSRKSLAVAPTNKLLQKSEQTKFPEILRQPELPEIQQKIEQVNPVFHEKSRNKINDYTTVNIIKDAMEANKLISQEETNLLQALKKRIKQQGKISHYQEAYSPIISTRNISLSKINF